jgi:hypothetical protein
MPEWLIAALLVERILEVRERRLLTRERRWLLRIEIARRIVLPLAIVAFVAHNLSAAPLAW